MSLTALRGICTKLGALREGRKALILVSEGYTALLPPQLRSICPADCRGLGNPTRDPFAGENNLMEDRARFSAEMDLQQELQDVFDAANRNNTAIYAVDPRGLSAGEFDISTNISIQTSQAYLIRRWIRCACWPRTPTAAPSSIATIWRGDEADCPRLERLLPGRLQHPGAEDGKFHEIKVRVKRPGVQVRARKGYWAYSADDLKRAVAGPKPGPPAAVTKALAAIAPLTNRRFVRTWIGNDKGDEGRTKVTLVWEPLPPTPGMKRDEPRRVTVLATSPTGDIVYRGRVPAELAVSGQRAASSASTRRRASSMCA